MQNIVLLWHALSRFKQFITFLQFQIHFQSDYQYARENSCRIYSQQSLALYKCTVNFCAADLLLLSCAGSGHLQIQLQFQVRYAPGLDLVSVVGWWVVGG